MSMPRRVLILSASSGTGHVRAAQALGAAIRLNNLPVAASKIARLLDDPERVARMRAAARAMA